MKGFLRDIYLRPSCYQCSFKEFKSGSDITLGDYWGIQNILPDFDDDKGISLVIVNTEKGRTLYERLNKIDIETTYEDALKGNSMLEKSVRKPAIRDTFFKKWSNRAIIPLIAQLTHDSFKARFIFPLLRKTGLLPLIRRILKR